MSANFTPGPYLHRGRYVCGQRDGLQIWSAYVDSCKPAVDTAELEAVATLFQASPLLYEALEAVEWSGEETWDNVQGVFVGTCPDCGTLKGDRHHSECLINNALRAARGEK